MMGPKPRETSLHLRGTGSGEGLPRMSGSPAITWFASIWLAEIREIGPAALDKRLGERASRIPHGWVELGRHTGEFREDRTGSAAGETFRARFVRPPDRGRRAWTTSHGCWHTVQGKKSRWCCPL